MKQLRELYERGLISKEEDLRIRMSDIKFGRYDATWEEINREVEKEQESNLKRACNSY